MSMKRSQDVHKTIKVLAEQQLEAGVLARVVARFRLRLLCG